MAKKEKAMLVVKSKMKEHPAAKKMNMSSDAHQALNEIAHWHVERAAARAMSNGRKTIQARDF